jgi:molybdopterin-guanine dinucleotide biosynthesis protein A
MSQDKVLLTLAGRPLAAALAAVAAAIRAGDYQLSRLYPRLRRGQVTPDEYRPFDPRGVLFENVNTPEDLQRVLTKVTSDQ